MGNKPDLSDITKKLDLNNLMSNIKSMINPDETPDVDPDDAIGVKIAEISILAQEISKTQGQLTKSSSKLNDLLNDLYKDIEALRAQHGGGDTQSKKSASADDDTPA